MSSCDEVIDVSNQKLITCSIISYQLGMSLLIPCGIKGRSSVFIKTMGNVVRRTRVRICAKRQHQIRVLSDVRESIESRCTLLVAPVADKVRGSRLFICAKSSNKVRV